MVTQFLRRFYFRLPIFIRLFSTVLVVMISFGICMHHIEPKQFPTYFDGIWWAFVTASTVGYGDLIPETLYGKILAIVLILSGAGLVTFYLATIAAGTVKYTQDLSKGLTQFKGSNHIIIIGWNERARTLLGKLNEKHPEQSVVLIDQSLTMLPIENILYTSFAVMHLRIKLYKKRISNMLRLLSLLQTLVKTKNRLII